jgi:pimeloyl-ACP methyl ester carboxylesterase
MADYARRGDCIVVGPTFPEGYQGLGAAAEGQLLRLVAELRRRFRLRERLFVAGFSGGAQFAHRFALKNPAQVIGCAAHSGGTWATGDMPGDIIPSEDAPRLAPFVISCGERDTDRSAPSVPLNRLDFARKFEREVLRKGGYLYKAAYIRGAGHVYTAQAASLTEECFRLATTGLAPDEMERLEELLEPTGALARRGTSVEAAAGIQAFRAEWAKAQDAARVAGSLIPGWSGGESFLPERKRRAAEYVESRLQEIRAAPSDVEGSIDDPAAGPVRRARRGGVR